MLCEVLSQSTEIKMPIYARFGVAHAWLVDPRKRTLETDDLIDRTWQESGRYGGQDVVRAVPFDAIGLDLADLRAP